MALDRRGFLGSLSTLLNQSEAPSRPVRPPGSDRESDFAACTTCEAPCITKCEEGIILLDEAHTPTVDFSKGGCTYCGECIDACPSAVLVRSEEQPLIDMSIEINLLKCLAWNRTICSLCKDPCLDDAIRFLGLFRPEIEADKCTQCGFCVSVCPTQAVEINVKG